MACLTLVLSILFRLKYHKINHLPRNLSANVFDKTFNVFNPYPERRRIIHSFLSALPFIAALAALVFVVLALKVFESGLLLSLLLLIICLNLMLIEVASETYQNAKTFINAFNNKADLGAGDLKVFKVLRRALPKLSNYYLALSILFLTLAAMLDYVWSSLLWFFAGVIGLILELQASIGGTIAFPVSVLLFSLMVGVVQIFIWKVKNKFLSHLLGT
jgi:hypothetical protein